MAHIARYFNGFIVIGIILLVIGIAGLATGNRLLAEPGQPVNPNAWLLYLGAAAIMIVNGVISIRLAAHHAPAEEAAGAAKIGDKAHKSETARR